MAWRSKHSSPEVVGVQERRSALEERLAPGERGLKLRVLPRRLGQLAVDLRVDTGVVQGAGDDRDRDGSQLGAVGVRTGEVVALRRRDDADDQPDDDQ